MFLKTGYIFELPEIIAKELKTKFPYEYKIVEKNGKKFQDKNLKKNISEDENSIYEKVIDKSKK
jgi:hypothetical protein